MGRFTGEFAGEITIVRRDLRFEVEHDGVRKTIGGGQPIGAAKDAVMARMKALYTIDRNAPLRLSHRNASVQRLYDEFLGKPLGEKSHHLLHTHYQERDVMA